MNTCTCSRIKVGGRITQSFNWDPDCAQHGTQSDWYRSPEQTARRHKQSARLRDLQQRAREARAAARSDL